jgi:hypothetical protein
MPHIPFVSAICVWTIQHCRSFVRDDVLIGIVYSFTILLSSVSWILWTLRAITGGLRGLQSYRPGNRCLDARNVIELGALEELIDMHLSCRTRKLVSMDIKQCNIAVNHTPSPSDID